MKRRERGSEGFLVKKKQGADQLFGIDVEEKVLGSIGKVGEGK
jgi:hypothetical protein